MELKKAQTDIILNSIQEFHKHDHIIDEFKEQIDQIDVYSGELKSLLLENKNLITQIFDLKKLNQEQREELKEIKIPNIKYQEQIEELKEQVLELKKLIQQQGEDLEKANKRIEELEEFKVDVRQFIFQKNSESQKFLTN